MGGVNVRLLANGEMVIDHPDLHDYKFFCFGGKVRCFKIDFGRHTEHHANYYNPQGNRIPFGEVDCMPAPEKQLEIPVNIQQMIQLAETLSSGHPFLRVDFYNVSGRILFGEITFFPASGLGRFSPEEWDATLGSWIQLPVN